ncbi:MAG TPA: DsrE family protein [Thiobacillus sp.]
MNIKLSAIAVAAFVAMAPAHQALAEAFAPYGTAKVDMHKMPATDTVFDVNYEDPNKLGTLYNFVKNTKRETGGKVVIVTHGPELRAFAKENYGKYQGIMDNLAELAKDGVEFKMCNNAMKAAGYSAEDMHGFITVVPAGFPEVAYWQGKGYKYINPLPLPVKDVRYIDQPQLKK